MVLVVSRLLQVPYPKRYPAISFSTIVDRNIQLSSLFTVGGKDCKGELEPWTRRINNFQNVLGHNGLSLDEPTPSSGFVTTEMQTNANQTIQPIFRWLFGKYESLCHQSTVIIPSSFSREYGDHESEVRVLIHTPKEDNISKKDKQRPVLIYAHGGAGVYFSADAYRPVLSRLAIELNVEIYNVDVRLAPQHPCPAAAYDVYTTVKYIHANSQILGIDPSRVGMAGESSGGHAILGTSILLAQRNEGHLVKCVFPDITPTTDYWLTTPKDDESMHHVNRQSYQMRPGWIVNHPAYKDMASKMNIEANFGHMMWFNLAGGKDPLSLIDEPLMFPGLMSDDLLENVPPMVVISSEFCFFIEDAKYLIQRLKSKEKLLDSLIIPGGIHVSWLFGLPGTEQYFCHRRMLCDRHL